MLKTGFKSTELWRKVVNWNLYCPRRKLTKASSNGFLYFPLLALLTEINY